MSNDVPTPKTLFSVFIDTVDYLINNQKYFEAYRKIQFSLDQIIQHNHFGAHFRESTLVILLNRVTTQDCGIIAE